MQTQRENQITGLKLAALSFAIYLPVSLIYIVLMINGGAINTPWGSQYLAMLEELSQTPGHPLVNWFYGLDSSQFSVYVLFVFPVTLILCLVMNGYVNEHALNRPVKRIPSLWVLAFGIALPILLNGILLTCAVYEALSVIFSWMAIGALGIGVCLFVDLIRCIRLLRRHKDNA